MKRLISIFPIIFSLIVACGDIKKSTQGNFNEDDRVVFDNIVASSSAGSSVTFSAGITSTVPIKSVSLWIEKDGIWVLEDTLTFDVLLEDIFLNGDFETYSIDIATYWNIWQSLTADIEFSKDIHGYAGNCQKIVVNDPGSWGVFIFQEVALEALKEYQWSFWYKTVGGASLNAQVTGEGIEDILLEEELPVSNGKWQHGYINYETDVDENVKLRVASESAQTFMVDKSEIREVVTKSSDKEVEASFGVDLDPGTYRWYIEVLDEKGALFSDVMTVSVF